MSDKLIIVPESLIKTFTYVKHVFSSNNEYTEDDIEWMMNIIQSNIKLLIKNSYNFYKFLTITNLKCFTGYFSHVYNFKLVKSVKDRHSVNFINHILNLDFDEFEQNNLLNDSEYNELKNILELDILTSNITLKRLTLNSELVNFIDKTFEESCIDIYNNLYKDKIEDSKCNFQDFIIVKEYNQQTKTDHAYTFRLIDILIYIINENYPDYLNSKTIDIIREKFNLELKITEYNLRLLSNI